MTTESSTLEMEDQVDDEFFDNLVEDENYKGKLVNKVLDEAKTSRNNNCTNVVTSERVDLKGNVESGIYTENVEMEDGEMHSLRNCNVANDTIEVRKLDDKKSEENLQKDPSVKEVDWSAFNFGGNGTGSYSDFFNELSGSSDNLFGNVENRSGLSWEHVGSEPGGACRYGSSVSSGQNQDGQNYWLGSENSVTGQDQSIEYWESLYPGWKYDVNTGQWFQSEGYNEIGSSLPNYDNNTNDAGLVNSNVVTTQQSNLSYYPQTCHSDGTVLNYNQGSNINSGYPAHMLFDPQYPDWYYDSIAQEWKPLQSYTAALIPPQVGNLLHSQNVNLSTVESMQGQNHSSYRNFGEPAGHSSPSLMRNDQSMRWCGTIRDNDHQNFNNSQLQSYLFQNSYSSNYYACNSADQQNQQAWHKPSVTATSYEQANGCNANEYGVVGSFNPDENLYSHINEHKSEGIQQRQFSASCIDNQKTQTLLQQPAQNGYQSFSTSIEGRSSTSRPRHALVSFGFGGKLIVMRDHYSPVTNSLSSQVSDEGVTYTGGVIDIISLTDLAVNTDASSIRLGARDYFCTLCEHSLPGPLVGMSVSHKELTRWIDDKTLNCGSPVMDYRKSELIRLLFSLLKIACHYKGKLRSPYGTDHALKDSDSPESAVAELFASAKKKVTEYGDLGRYVQSFPSEWKMQTAALEVQKLLVTGRIKEALQFAQEGQLWGPALVLAIQLGDQFYGETVKQMALRQLIAGSPLRTLCLLISGQPADVFCCSDNSNSLYVTEMISQQPSQIAHMCELWNESQRLCKPGQKRIKMILNNIENICGQSLKNLSCRIQAGALAMLCNWEENLAIITANRTKNDELVILHLGDCLLKEKAEVIGAHICYLVADANFGSYSDSARMCLISADHWRSPRTYASPEAIQMTELYEYSKSLGNPQFLLLPFQPYKLIYAFMLAEVGKITEALRYCQAILKCWKIGRAPEVDTWKHLVSSLEERLRIYQQGGYAAGSSPAKLVGKFLKLFDSTAQRVVGGLPPPVPLTSHSNATHNHDNQKGARVSSSQSTTAMPSLVPSESMEPISEWTGNQKPRHSRSISEPDIGKSPRKSDSSKDESLSDMHENGSGFGGYYQFGRFGSQLFQKTVGMVLRARPDRQAKLGETNKFYYDENLKRWVEEGVDHPSEEAKFLPPPTTSALQKKASQENLKDGFQADNLHGSSGPNIPSPGSSDSSLGIPPMPRSSVNSTARGRMGIRARYVDTFNKGGAMAAMPTNILPSSGISQKPGSGPNAKFFVPTPMSFPSNEMERLTGEHIQESNIFSWSPTSFTEYDSPSPKLKPLLGALKRNPSMGNILSKSCLRANGNSPLAPHSRRTVSWSGSFDEVSYIPDFTGGYKTPGEGNDLSPHLFLSPAGSSIPDDFQEVELK